MSDQWATLAALVRWLDAANGTGDQEAAMRVLKVTEEAGEVAAALIGMAGQNPRKGVTHTAEDVAEELVDVAVTALVALHSFTPDPEAMFTTKLADIAQRVHATAQDTPDPQPP
ncbi:MazG-like family protein [Sphaerisporangium corydalis]|uniref:MazG-like family protein n=1 Tax=Sphaerisporangium corydalis TaxID=1441875 RepID=A0ABV9EEJ6_9ACTN|nr:MazG-like family protein [Sphaerisporangium corydalis]